MNNGNCCAKKTSHNDSLIYKNILDFYLSHIHSEAKYYVKSLILFFTHAHIHIEYLPIIMNDPQDTKLFIY